MLGIEENKTTVQKFVLKNFWLIPALMSAITFISEYIDHLDEGRLLANREFLTEVFVLSIVIPVILGIIIFLFNRTFIHSEYLTSELDRLRKLSKRLASAYEWDDILTILSKFLNKLVSLEKICLSVYNPDKNQFEFVSVRDAQNAAASSEHLIDCPSLSEITTRDYTQFLPQDSKTHFDYKIFMTDCSKAGTQRYFIPLTLQEKIFAILHFNTSDSEKLTPQIVQEIIPAIPKLTMAAAHIYSNKYFPVDNQFMAAERQRIARMLHDTLAQDLSYLRLKLDLIKEQDSLVGILEVQKDLERMQQVAQNAYDQVRGTLDELLPDIQKNLNVSLPELAELICEPAEIAIKVTNTGAPQPLTSNTKQHVLAITREALLNAVKYSQSTQFDMNIHWCENQFTLELNDHGVGFEPHDFIKDNHYGMIFMRESAEAIGAELDIVTCKQNGTQVILKLPYAKPAIQLEG